MGRKIQVSEILYFTQIYVKIRHIPKSSKISGPVQDSAPPSYKLVYKPHYITMVISTRIYHKPTKSEASSKLNHHHMSISIQLDG